MTLKIQKISKIELKSLQKIAQESFFETYAALNTVDKMNHYLKHNLSLSKLKEEFNNPSSAFYFAKVENREVGYLKVNIGNAQTEPIFENALEIERIYVLEQFQKRKVGKQLLEKAVKIAKEQKLERIWLGVWIKNPNAITFYKKQGFKECGTHVFQFVDEAQTDVLMTLDLNY